MAGEVQADVDDAYAGARRTIEKSFNSNFAGRSFGSGLTHLTYLAIILKIESPEYNEIKKYKKKKSSAEFRLKISYDGCLQADASQMLRLVTASLRRAIELLKGMRISDFDCGAFEMEFLALARREDWLA